MKKRKFISILVLLCFAVLGFIFLKGRTHDLVKILEVDLKYVIILLILAILASLFRGHMLKLLIEHYNIKIKFKEWWGLQILTAFWNALTPFKGGLPAKAIYLKKKYKLPYTFSVSLIGINYLTNFLTYGVLGIILIFFISVSNELKYSLLIFFIILFLSSLFILFFLPLPIKTNIRILKYIAKIINEIQYIRTNYLLLFKILLNSIVRFLIGTLMLYFAFHAFNSEITFYNCLMMNIILGLMTIISITPMGLGFKEFAIIITSKLLVAETLIGVFVAVLYRTINLVWIFVAAPIFSYLLLKNFKQEGIK